MIVQYLPEETDVPLNGFTPGNFYEGPIMDGDDINVSIINITDDNGTKLRLFLLDYFKPVNE